MQEISEDHWKNDINGGEQNQFPQFGLGQATSKFIGWPQWKSSSRICLLAEPVYLRTRPRDFPNKSVSQLLFS